VIYIIFVGIFHLLFALVSRIELHVLNEMQLIIFIIFSRNNVEASDFAYRTQRRCRLLFKSALDF